MVTIGDTLAVIGILFGVCLSSWAVLMGFASFFPHRADKASASIERAPWKCAIGGLALWLTVGVVGLVLLGLPNPVLKLIGMFWVMAMLAITTVGAAGMSQILGRRFRAIDGQMSEYAGLSRGSMVVVVSTLLPFVGWFAIAPLILAIGLGSGVASLFASKAPKTNAQPQFEVGG